MADHEDSNLRATIKLLAPKINAHRHQQITEEETKQWLIAPLLGAVGWHTDDPGEVRYEYKANHQCNPVDYHLLTGGKVRLVIEAKRLNLNLDTGLTQLFGNLGVAGGVNWCVLTDGNLYRVYRAAGDGNAEDKLFFEVSISGDEEAASKMLGLLSRSNMASDPPLIETEWHGRQVGRQAKIVLQEMLNGTDPALVNGICKRYPAHTASTVTAALARLVIEVKERSETVVHAAPNAGLPCNGDGSVDVGIKQARNNGYDVFTRLLAQPIKRQDLIAAFIKERFSSETATSYIAWAKRVVEPSPDLENGQQIFNNPFFFEIESYKDNAGVVWLRKKPGRDFRHQREGDTPFKDWVGR